MGCANPEGATGRNIARQIAIRAGCPVSTAGMTVNRFCSSGLQTIAIAAQRIMTGEGDIFAAGGVESISLRAERDEQAFMLNDDWIVAHKPELYWPMLQTAEYVAKNYGISREAAGSSTACAASSAPPRRARRAGSPTRSRRSRRR